MHNDAMRKFILASLFLATFIACDNTPATDAGIDAVAVDASQDSTPIGPDVVSIDAPDASDSDL